MEHNFGAKKQRIRTNIACNLPLVAVSVAFFMMGLLVLPTSTVKDQPIYAILCNIAGLLVLAFMLVQMFHCHIQLYENAIVIVSTFSKKVILREDIKVIHWDRPGAYEGTTHTVVRKNNEIAEVMLRGGKMVKITDAMYKAVPKHLGEWQEEYKIAHEF